MDWSRVNRIIMVMIIDGDGQCGDDGGNGEDDDFDVESLTSGGLVSCQQNGALVQALVLSPRQHISSNG